MKLHLNFSQNPALILGSITIVAITILSLLPPETGLEIKKDKLGHFITYFVLSANALFFAKNGRAILFIFLAVCGYGGFLEFLQGFVSGRQPSTWDILPLFQVQSYATYLQNAPIDLLYPL